MRNLFVITLVAAGLAMSACGRKGPLEPPPGAEPQAALTMNVEHG